MSAFLNNLFWGYFPYKATTVMIAGVIYRRVVSDQTIEAPSTQFMDEDGPLMKSSILFHYAIFWYWPVIYSVCLPHQHLTVGS